MVIVVSRDKDNYSKQEFLWFLTNKLGFNVEIAHNYMYKGEKYFSKWKSFMWLLSFDNDEYIPELKCTRQEFINKATHRSVLDIEILIDVDEAEPFKTIKDKAKAIIEFLKDNKIKHSVYFSGSKSYHISALMPELRSLNYYEKAKAKREILTNFGGDTMKASNRNMIALEGEYHWKTGKEKVEVEL